MNYGNYFYAFDPNNAADKDEYKKNILLISTIRDVLNEYRINVKSKGYMFMQDAICIITDLQRMDICFEKEVYPLIAKKYDAGGSYAIEHGIRNAINKAYDTFTNTSPESSGIFDMKPTNKTFLLMATQGVGSRLLKELID